MISSENRSLAIGPPTPPHAEVVRGVPRLRFASENNVPVLAAGGKPLAGRFDTIIGFDDACVIFVSGT